MTITEKLVAYHHPEFIDAPEGGDGAHVCEVWEDGEITLTKGGSLYGQRNLHMIDPPLRKALPIDVMPRKCGNHANVVCRYEEREMVRALIAAELGLEKGA